VVVKHWIAAIDGGDLEAIVACFDRKYQDEAPARRGAHVRGDAEVRENYVRLHRDLAELRAELLDAAVHGPNVWMEWRLRGRREDGTLMSSPSSAGRPGTRGPISRSGGLWPRHRDGSLPPRRCRAAVARGRPSQPPEVA
jgi:hypothetical protein